MAVTREQVAKLYVANFNRAPDAAGLDYWISDGTDATTTLTDLNAIAAAMQAGAEASSGVSSLSDADYVISLYSSMFGRTVAADSTDVTYWTDALTAGDVTRANMIQTLIAGAEADTGSAADAAVLANKTTVGLYYADTLGLTGTDFSLSSVTDDTATVTTAKADADTYVPVSLSLTTGTDDLTGSKGDDTFTADILTVTANDSVVDASGTDNDTMNIITNANIASTVTITDVENINVSSLGAHSIDMTNITGVDAFTTSDSTGAITLNNVSEATMALAFSGSSTNNITANYSAGALSGTADALAVNTNTASSVNLDVDAGFESVTITNTGGATTLAAITVPGVTTMTLAGDAAMTINDNVLNAFTTVSITNTAAISTGVMTGVSTLTASSNTGGIVDADVSATTGYATNSITGATTGATIILGSGDDNIKVVDAATSNTDTIKLGAGNDTLQYTNDTTVASYLFGEAGDDTVNVLTGALATTDLIDLGTGTDTLILAASVAHQLVTRGVENLTLTTSGAGAGAAVVVNSSDSAYAVTAKITNTNDQVNLTGLKTGSTFATAHTTSSLTTTVGDVTLGFASGAAETTTLDIATGSTGDFTLTNIADATITLGAASNLTTNGTGGGDITLDAVATDLTINATGAFTMDDVLASGTDALANLSVTSTAGVTVDDITNSDALATLTASGTSVNIGDIVAADDLTTVSVVASGTGATSAAIGALGTTGADMTNLSSMTVTGATTATVGEINAVDIGTMSLTASNGLLTVDNIVASDDVGTITLTSTLGAITLTDTDNSNKIVDAVDDAGITVNMTAKTYINEGGTSAGTAIVVENDGDITSTLSGAAAAKVNYTTSGNAGSVNLTASSLTGGLTTTVTNDETSGNGSSTITLGALNSSTANSVTLAGYSNSVTVSGSAGADTIIDGGTGVDGAAANVVNSSDTFAGSSGTDILSYATHAFTDTNTLATNEATTNGLAMNFSSSTVTFNSGQTYATTLAAGKVAQYDSAATGTTTNSKAILAGGEIDTVSGFETVVGTAKADYIKVASTGMNVTGGAGADTLVAGAGNDIFTYTATTEGGDTITSFGALGTDQIALKDTAFTLGVANAVTTQATGTVSAALVFSGANMTAAFATTKVTGAGATGVGGNTFGVLFLDTSGTDAGLYYVKGTYGGTKTFSASATVTVALTGTTNQIAAADIVII